MASTTTADADRNAIPREFRIPNPIPPFVPQVLPALEPFPTDSYHSLQILVSGPLQKYELDPNVQTTPALRMIQEHFQGSSSNSLIDEITMRQFLIACQNQLIKLMSAQSLSKTAILHHEIYTASLIIKEKINSRDLSDFADMMMGEAVDLYHQHFSDIVEQKFWAKTKTVDDLISIFLKKEFERLRQLNPYTFKQLTTVALRKCIDSAPNSSVSTLLAWVREQKLSLD